ncbi:ferritin-like domain-containing protein [Rubrivirga sp. S365]|uniref:YciE/YciF ferroxidase family protein n=1 Tax=Rubrivirga sp. S365 TaxID=3076080 RepID=UPI0028C7CF42|nr:ferritin-like domain-containing protein [Rubrivirga sp. S365]MDT7855199.1 ferritin-like domain-containing protein [Rubrivirga sp. S365]
MAQITDLRGLLLHGLKDMYYAEKQSEKALSDMAGKASNDDLKKQLKEHGSHSDEHLKRLEKVFDMLGEKAEGVTCEAMDGILKEARHLMDEVSDDATRDAAIVFSAQAIDHYEITRYGSLATFAERLGHQEASDLLGDSLGEEEEADERLSQLAESVLNQKAA